MAAYRRGGVYLTRWMQCRGVQFHTRGRKPIHLERRILEAVSAPIILEQHQKDPAKSCSVLEEEKLRKLQGQEEVNLYEQFLIRKCKESLQQSRMIVVFQKTSMKAEEVKAIKNKLFPLGIDLKFFFHEIITQALENSKWTNLSQLLHPQNLYVVSEEFKVAELVKATKLMPELMMLGGIVDDKMYTREGLLHLGSLPSIDMLYGQTVSILNSNASGIRNLLSSHQQQLTRNLEQYVKDQQGVQTDSPQPNTNS